MRFVSLYGRYAVQIQHQVSEHYATGMSRVIQPQVMAEFFPHKLLPEERQLAIDRWKFNGFYQEEDQVTQVAPDYRIGLFDSREAQIQHGWSDELREHIEQVLCEKADRFEDLFAVPEQKLTPPWPRYDSYGGTPTALLRKLLDEGHDLDATLAYERANQNRPKVLEEIERELAEPTVEREEVVQG